MHFPSFESLRRTALTLAISAAGGGLGHLAGIPAGWIMGGALAVTAAVLAGVKVEFPGWLRDVSFVLVGLSMGANVDRSSLALIGQWPITLAALALELVIIVLLTGWMLKRFFHLDAGTAYLSSFPGHLSFVIGIASAGVGDPRQIAIFQVVRILLLTICVPIGALFLPSSQVAGAAAPAPDMAWTTILLVGAACVVVGIVFLRLRVPAGLVLGSMAAAVTARLNGYFEGSLPEPLTVVTFIFVGAMLGTRFAGISAAELRRAAFGGVIATLLTVAIVTTVAYGASRLVDMPFGQIWLGLAPGALEGMGALAVALGMDTAFVAAHHVIRLLLLTFAIPLVALSVRPKPQAPQQD